MSKFNCIAEEETLHFKPSPDSPDADNTVRLLNLVAYLFFDNWCRRCENVAMVKLLDYVEDTEPYV